MESVSAAEPLTRDTPCIHCGYNLRGLAPGGLCPECGCAIDESLRGDLLRFANLDWLRRVRWGLSFALIAIAIEAAWEIVTELELFVPILGIGLFIGSVGELFKFTSALLISTPEPHKFLDGKSVTIRRAIRGTAAADIILFMAFFFIFPDFCSGHYVVFYFIGALILLAKLISVLVLLASWAKRIPDRLLNRVVRILIRVAVIAALMDAVGFLNLVIVAMPGLGGMTHPLDAFAQFMIGVMGFMTEWLELGIRVYLGLLLLRYRVLFGKLAAAALN